MKPLNITIEDLKQIIEDAERLRKNDSSLSTTIELTKLRASETHLGSDLLSAGLKYNYAECISEPIYLKNQ